MLKSSVRHEQVLHIDERELQRFCGKNDARLAEIERHMDVKIVARGSMIKVIGDEEAVGRTVHLIEELLDVFRSGGSLAPSQMQYALTNAQAEDGERQDLRQIVTDRIEVPLPGRRIAPMTACQKVYVDAIRHNDVVFGIGPAGTGKTYLAVAMGLNLLSRGIVRRIILVRPAVEAGEKLGFLPGDIAQKINPYLRPLYDALYDMLDSEKVHNYLETGIIELAPLAFMRGRTLNDSFVILDEGQNTSREQMKMFLTRLGFGSKMVVTGDITQVDLAGRESGLIHAKKALRRVEGVAVVEFDKRDIVRHKLVQSILHAYEQFGAKGEETDQPRPTDPAAH